MPRVLITTDEPNFSSGLVEGYRAHGWEVVTGAVNFRIRAAHYDVIHHQWPEEFSRWTMPSPRELELVRQDLSWWKDRAFCIFTVNNLYPHQLEGNEACHALYSAFFENSHLVTHYTEASRSLVLKTYSAARGRAHLVHSPANYEVSLANQLSRGSRRGEMGIKNDEFVILVIGSLRSWEEVALVRKAYSQARISKKRLLMAGKLAVRTADRWWRWKAIAWRFWLKWSGAVVDTRRVPEEEISRFIDTCDLALVPRLSGLNSAIIMLAMTFGRPVVSPDLPGYTDYLVGTSNPIYKTGNPESLAAALERASQLDLEAIGRDNACIAATWTWKKTVRACFEAAAEVDVPAAASIREFLYRESTC